MDIEPSEVIETPESPVDTADLSEISLQSPVEVSEREKLNEEIDSLRKERGCLKSEVNKLLCSNAPLKAKFSVGDTEKSAMLTGLSSSILKILLNYLLAGHVAITRNKNRSMEDQILMTFVKLKHNMTFELLAYITNIYASSSKIII